MAANTKIAWCDSTLNWWEGCTKITEGCRFCYAEARDKRFTGGKLWGKGAPRRKSKSAVKDALAFNRKPWICDGCGEAFADTETGLPNPPHFAAHCKPNSEQICHGKDSMQTFHRRRIFSLSLGDWLDAEVPIEWLAEMLDTIRQCDQVIWILCTKRPENFFSRLSAAYDWSFDQGNRNICGFTRDWMKSFVIPRNIILLTSVENQEQADKRIPELLKIPAACRGLSLEPLLGPVKLTVGQWLDSGTPIPRPKLDWMIIGGESGPNARPCNVDWIRSLVKQGQTAGVATFVKQLGAQPVESDGLPLLQDAAIPFDKKGGNPAEWPTDVRIQQWPKGF